MFEGLQPRTRPTDAKRDRRSEPGSCALSMPEHRPPSAVLAAFARRLRTPKRPARRATSGSMQMRASLTRLRQFGGARPSRTLTGSGRALLPGEHSRFLDAHHARLSARLSSKRNTGGVEQRFNRAIELFRELAIPFWLAVSLLEYGEFLESQRRHGEAEPLLKEARETFERLHARPWLERVAFAASPPASRVAPTAS
jgi:hypothetical protein